MIDDGRVLSLLLFGVLYGIVTFNLLYRTIPIGISEKAGDASEIHYRETEFTLVLPDAGSPADDLFKLRHGVDVLVQNDQFRQLAV